jgi:hypothetical protein
VKLGEPFRLSKGEKARLPGKNAFLRITGFVNSPCPKGARCIWSGQAVHFEVSVDGATAPARGASAPFSVDVRESDYVSYAVFVVDTPEGACERQGSGAGQDCLRRLYVERASAEGCRGLSDERTRRLCLDDLAEKLERAELCAEVPDSSQYCRYLRAKKEGDRALCEGIILHKWREKCEAEVPAKKP